MKKKKAEVWMKPLLAAVLCAAITIGGGTGTLVIAEDGNGEPTTTETTQSAETTPTGEATQPTDTETPKTGNEQAPADGDTKDDGKKGNAPVTGDTDAQEDSGNSSTSESQEPAPAKENPLDLDKSTPASEAVAEAAPTTETDKKTTGFSAYLQAGNTKVDLTDTGDGSELTIGWADAMTLHIDADFAEGSDKIIEISLPQGMTFNSHNDGNARYVTSDLTNFLKEKIVSTDQTDEAKKSQVILGQQQYNGTMTLKFFSQGEANDVSQVSFDVIVGPAYFTSRNNQVWESGAAWFYDKVDNPVTVTQYMNGEQVSQKLVKSLQINNDDTKQYGKSWTQTYNPDVLPGGQTPGGEYFYVRPVPGGNHPTAYKYFSITYFVPDMQSF